MQFFTKQDFDYYASVIGVKYKSGTSLAKELKTRLTDNGVFDKTKHWAQLIEKEGYPIISKNTWQDYLKVRSYTWARVYLNGYENTNVYFTIGVGSRLSTPSDKLNLIIKIDCHRKDLAPFQIQAFDKYRDHFIKNWLIEIPKEDLPNYNWNSLTNRTKIFIEKNRDHYIELVRVIWPNGINVQPKVARLCWNDLGWEKPSGSEGKSKNKAHTFESNGYGHEEWLFDLDRSINNYHYGFIQAFNKGDHHGKTYDLHLYSAKRVKYETEWYWVGRIKRTEVLTKDEQKEIFETYRDNGWYQQMMNELKDVGVNSRDLEIVSEEELFNVKFKVDSDNLIVFDDLKSIDNPKSEIGPGYGRYALKDLYTETDSVVMTSSKYQFKAGHNPTKTGKTKSNYTKKTIDRTLKHKEIQEHMYHQLVKTFGKEYVGTEVPTGHGTSIDVVVKKKKGPDWFYEVKTYNQPVICIREAFGQILEYAMFSEENHASKLIIVGTQPLNSAEESYIKHLRKKTGLNLYYQFFETTKNILNPKLF